MGDMRLPAPRQKELLEKFERFEEKVIGKGKHEELHQLLKELQKKYTPTRPDFIQFFCLNIKKNH